MAFEGLRTEVAVGDLIPRYPYGANFVSDEVYRIELGSNYGDALLVDETGREDGEERRAYAIPAACDHHEPRVLGHVAGTSIRDFLSLPANARVQMCFDAFGGAAAEADC